MGSRYVTVTSALLPLSPRLLPPMHAFHALAGLCALSLTRAEVTVYSQAPMGGTATTSSVRDPLACYQEPPSSPLGPLGSPSRLTISGRRRR
jgi:hypothetical protein